MNFTKRAWFAVKRKPSRTIILLVLFIAIANFVFAGIAIQHATEKASILARQKLGGTLTLTYDYQKALEGMRSARQQGVAPGVNQAATIRSAFSSQPIPKDGALQLSTHPDIIDFNFLVSTFAMAQGFSAVTGEDPAAASESTPAPTVAPTATASTTASTTASQSTANRPITNPNSNARGNNIAGDVSITGVNTTALLDSFNDGTAVLLEGEHISAGATTTDESVISEYNALIEKNLAEQNNIIIGDKIIIAPIGATVDTATGIYNKTITLTVKGIYEAGTTAQSSIAGFGRLQGMSFMQPYNMIYTDYGTALEIKTAASEIAASAASSNTQGSGAFSIGTVLNSVGNTGIDSVVYYVNDPANIENIITELKNLTNSNGTPLIDWDVFKLDANSAAYEQMMGPVESVAAFSMTIVWIVSIAGALILALLLMLSIRERMHETGVLLSMGEPKSHIVGQYILEMVIVAFLAFTISIFSGAVIADKVGDSLVKREIAMSASSMNNPNGAVGAARANRLNQQRNVISRGIPGVLGSAGITNEDPVSEIDISIDLGQISQLFLAGLIIIMAATAIPATSIMRYNPKTILTKAG